MIRSSRAGRRNVETAELNITAFMNLMVILVPFLLITAVFSRLTVLELNLPGSSSEPVEQQDQTFQLEIIVRQDKIEVGDRNQGLLGIYPNTDDGAYDYAALADKLRELKERAAATKVSLAQLVNDVLRRGLDAPDVENPRPAPQPTFAMGPARVDLTKALSIADTLEGRIGADRVLPAAFGPDAEAILGSDDAKVLHMHFVRKVGRDDITEAWVEGFEKNAKAQLPQLKYRIGTLNSAMQDLEENDALVFSYIPGKGTSIEVKGNTEATIDGPDFAVALLAIWLGDPPNDEIKRGLLGGACD